MSKNFKSLTLFVSLFLIFPSLLHAQVPEGASDRFIRVAEIGQLVDSVNVWGNVTDPGRYLVPEGTNLTELISYSFGYTQQQGSGNNDFSKTQIEVKVSRYNENERLVEVAFFRYRYHDPEPPEMFEFIVQNNDLVTIQVRNRPSFGDYVGVIAPVISVIATSILLIENLRGN